MRDYTFIYLVLYNFPLSMTERVGNVDKFFKGQQAQEEVVCFFRKHWITVLPCFTGLALFIVIETVFFLSFPFLKNLFAPNASVSLLLVGIMILATAYLHKIFMRIFVHFMQTVIFTNSRIIEYNKSLFVHDSQEILDVVKVQDVKKSQEGIFRSLLKYGNLTITLSSSEASKLITCVPNINFHLRCLSRIKRDAFLQGQVDGLGRREMRGLKGYPVEEFVETIGMEVENALSEKQE